MLRHNDEIRLPKPMFKVFIYYDCYDNDKSNFPKELRDKFIIMKEIGRGKFGQVRLALRLEDNKRCAVKILKKKILKADGIAVSLNNLELIKNEIKVLQSVDHKCIVGLYDVVQSEENMYLVLELAEGGELFDRIKKMPEQHLPEKV